MNKIVTKLSSRKFWMALAGVATGVAVILGADTSEIQTIAGTIAAMASAMTYIFVEGKVDAAALPKEGKDEVVSAAAD